LQLVRQALTDGSQAYRPQLVPVATHWPAALHADVVFVDVPPEQRSAAHFVPAAIGWQVPAVVAFRLQDMQAPQLVTPQQTPSVQKPLAQSVAAVHVLPSGFFPHTPAMQKFPETQSVSAAQVAPQIPALQRYGAQDWRSDGWQTPAPSQARASIAALVPAGQVAAAQVTPTA
jgi:hypothetical protein